MVRVRFAPSPTGFLHLGGLRTALFNYVFAKQNNGKFILRIEDTDRQRKVTGAMEQLQCDLNWAGIEINEGPNIKGNFGPYIQSERLNIYKKYVDFLLANDSAYHCFCTDKRLELIRKESIKLRHIPKYDNKCRDLHKDEVKSRLEDGQVSCIRFKLTPGAVKFNDLVYGIINYDVSQNEGDPIIIKSDSFPTYHFANVVDDHCMHITHVLRGVEWQISTTKHLLLYKAFNWVPPEYAHLPLLLNSDGSKLSKRQCDIRISHYRDVGIFPLSLINLIAISGGGFNKDSIQHQKPKCYTLEELVQQFNISRINSHSGKVMSERLLEFNRLELKRKLKNGIEEKELIKQIQIMLNKICTDKSLYVEPSNRKSEYIKNILHWSIDRITKLSDLFSEEYIFIWILPSTKIDAEQIINIKEFLKEFSLCKQENRNELNIFIKDFCKQNNLIYANFMKLLRSILSGSKKGPSVAEIIEILGKKGTIKRLEVCLQHASK